MKKLFLLILLFVTLVICQDAHSQCSICTKTAQQMGHKPAKGLNSGIIYLMIAPLAIMGFVGFRWWRNNSQD
jgi:hypothetical protein